jgi:SAM-dependent methyltransferase
MKDAIPREVSNLDQCSFYHTVGLPEGTVEGVWDLRPVIDSYLGRVDFYGKKVLDVGTSTGFLSFHCENWASEVVSFDQSDEFPAQETVDWKNDPIAIWRMKSSYWYCHSRLKSKCRVVYGNVYDIPTDESFDVAILGSILLHLENPYGAIRSAGKVAETLIITEGYRPHFNTDHMVFRPSYPAADWCWWYIPPATACRMLISAGFTPGVPTFLRATGPNNNMVDLYSIVARRK